MTDLDALIERLREWQRVISPLNSEYYLCVRDAAAALTALRDTNLAQSLQVADKLQEFIDAQEQIASLKAENEQLLSAHRADSEALFHMQAEIERLREALEKIEAWSSDIRKFGSYPLSNDSIWNTARAALGEKE